MKLNPQAFGLTAGVLWVLGLLIISLVAWNSGYWTEAVEMIGSLYLGYELTGPGLLIGLVWAFFDGFICGWLFGWLYNRFA